MANRQHGRGRGPSGVRPVRSVPSAVQTSGTPAVTEPEVRRWPHPVGGAAEIPAGQQPDPTLHYIRCALSYQNQLLADIKALLERLAEERPESSTS